MSCSHGWMAGGHWPEIVAWASHCIPLAHHFVEPLMIIDALAP